MLREFPLVITTVAKVSRKRELWLVVRVNYKSDDTELSFPISFIICKMNRLPAKAA